MDSNHFYYSYVAILKYYCFQFLFLIFLLSPMFEILYSPVLFQFRMLFGYKSKIGIFIPPLSFFMVPVYPPTILFMVPVYPPTILFMVPVFSLSLLICTVAYLIMLEFLSRKIAVNFK
jgi:hypothetical protein